MKALLVTAAIVALSIGAAIYLHEQISAWNNRRYRDINGRFTRQKISKSEADRRDLRATLRTIEGTSSPSGGAE